jgi:cytochrome c-type biogenesis protein CcmF
VLLAACFTVLYGTLLPVLSEFFTGSKITVVGPYYNKVMVPIGLFLLFLTGVGPLLAWRSTSLRTIRRNFILPCTAVLATAIGLMASGVRPWKDDDPTGSIYALVCFSLGAGVITAITSEFLRGAGVVRTQTGKNLFASAFLLTRRNTRRYGGYIIHFGIVVLFIGLAGAAFNQSKELEMGLAIPSLSTATSSSARASRRTPTRVRHRLRPLDVFTRARRSRDLTPERRVYFPDTDHAQASTMVAIHSTLAADLYVVFEGRNADSGTPIIKVFLNPLVNWIWIGVLIVILGTAHRAGPTAATRHSPRRSPRIAAFTVKLLQHLRRRIRKGTRRRHSRPPVVPMLKRSSTSSSCSPPPSACSAQATRHPLRHPRPQADVYLRLLRDAP